MTVRETYVYRPHDPRADENGMVPKAIARPLIDSDMAPMVIGDLPEYRTAAADKHTGKRMLIGGRRQHREFLKRNGYIEIGNDYGSQRREQMSQSDRIADIKRAMRID